MAFEAGVDIFMTKPVRFREVGRILEGWMRSREASASDVSSASEGADVVAQELVGVRASADSGLGLGEKGRGGKGDGESIVGGLGQSLSLSKAMVLSDEKRELDEDVTGAKRSG